MTDTGLLSTWVTWTPLQRAAVREVYFRRSTVTETAERNAVAESDVSRALQEAYHLVAQRVLGPEVDAEAPPHPEVSAQLHAVAAAPTATWRWDTTAGRMQWSDSLFELYGYPPGAVPATIERHQAHKYADDRVVVEKLVLTGATERGTVVFPQRIVRTDGTVCRVVMRVTRTEGPGEVLVGRVVADTAA